MEDYLKITWYECRVIFRTHYRAISMYLLIAVHIYLWGGGGLQINKPWNFIII